MTGLEIFDFYLNIKNLKNAKDREYSQLLLTIVGSLGESIYPLLEEAHGIGKRLNVVQNLEEDICIDYIMVEEIVFV